MTQAQLVSPDEATILIEQGALLVDVREDDEWEAGHAPGAVHIPMANLSDQDSSLADQSGVVLVCRSGGRSAKAAAALAGRGVTAYDLSGGMQAWDRAGLEVITDAGSPGSVI